MQRAIAFATASRACFAAENDTTTVSATIVPTHAANAPASKPEPSAAQPVPSAATVAAITTADTTKRKALAASLKAKRDAASKQAPVVVTGKQAKAKPGKPVTTTAKPKQAVKPVSAAEAKAREARNVAHTADRDLARRFYAGASLAAHAKRPASRDAYIARALVPVQRPADGNPSTRDDSGLALILSRSSANGVFDPSALAFDVGILSRLASCKLVTYDAKADAFALTQAGLSRARSIVNRAKRAASPAKQAANG